MIETLEQLATKLGMTHGSVNAAHRFITMVLSGETWTEAHDESCYVDLRENIESTGCRSQLGTELKIALNMK